MGSHNGHHEIRVQSAGSLLEYFDQREFAIGGVVLRGDKDEDGTNNDLDHLTQSWFPTESSGTVYKIKEAFEERLVVGMILNHVWQSDTAYITESHSGGNCERCLANPSVVCLLDRPNAVFTIAKYPYLDDHHTILLKEFDTIDTLKLTKEDIVRSSIHPTPYSSRSIIILRLLTTIITTTIELQAEYNEGL